MENEKFINRDISWLEFNSRVLNEATDTGCPLMERLKFLAIFSSNLDEFFMVRMAALTQQDPGVSAELPGILEQRVRELVTRQYAHFRDQILPALEKEHIRIVAWSDLASAEQDAARRVFEREIFPVLTPIGIDPTHPFPLVPNLGLELLVRLMKPSVEGFQERFAVLEAPAVVPRFIPLESQANSGNLRKFIPVEELIANNLEVLFNGCEILECSPFRVTRDIRNEAFHHLQVLPLSYLDSHPQGDTVSRVIGDVDTFADGLLMGFTQLFTGVMTIAGTLVLMLSIRPAVALVVIVITPLSLTVATAVLLLL